MLVIFRALLAAAAIVVAWLYFSSYAPAWYSALLDLHRYGFHVSVAVGIICFGVAVGRAFGVGEKRFCPWVFGAAILVTIVMSLAVNFAWTAGIAFFHPLPAWAGGDAFTKWVLLSGACLAGSIPVWWFLLKRRTES